MRGALLSAGLLLAGYVLQVLLPNDPARDRSEQLLGHAAARVELETGAAFTAGPRVALPFAAVGRQGEIRGVVVLDGGRIERVVVTDQREGTDLRAMARPEWLARFSGRRIDAPVVVDAVSGATLSSRVVVDIVNERLRAWRSRAGT
jgi:Na+-translocating ferredoxin:NAD+ oxidoreductase RnfG subunit